ncbi:hypothetical protein L2734_01905 [Parashewanella spongiae]|uniref:hypothetical protein n=1 Tax=Parashewanella spongiae TaxID=342950 RepID=UPI0014050227|nr:hypothetical protein [Parashewanella spongiae]MCL1076936.1 hypothetical protein [Parashewanella spongiae]
MPEKTFLLHYVKRAWEDGVKETAIDMVLLLSACRVCQLRWANKKGAEAPLIPIRPNVVVATTN